MSKKYVFNISGEFIIESKSNECMLRKLLSESSTTKGSTFEISDYELEKDLKKFEKSLKKDGKYTRKDLGY